MAFFTIIFFSIAPPITKYVLILGVEPNLLLALRYVVSTLLLAGAIVRSTAAGEAVCLPWEIQADSTQTMAVAAISRIDLRAGSSTCFCDTAPGKVTGCDAVVGWPQT